MEIHDEEIHSSLMTPNGKTMNLTHKITLEDEDRIFASGPNEYIFYKNFNTLVFKSGKDSLVQNMEIKFDCEDK
jgi:hypothetical protein